MQWPNSLRAKNKTSSGKAFRLVNSFHYVVTAEFATMGGGVKRGDGGDGLFCGRKKTAPSLYIFL